MMTDMLRRLFLVFAMLAVTLSADAKSRNMRSAMTYDVDAVHLTLDGDSLQCRIDINMISDAVAKKCAIVLQPYLLDRGERIDLRPIAYYRLDNRGEKYRVRSTSEYASGRDDEAFFVCGLGRGRFQHSSSVAAGISRSDTLRLHIETIEYRMTDHYVTVEDRLVAECVPRLKPEFYPDLFSVYVEPEEYRNAYTLTVPLRVTYDPKKKNTFDAKYEDNEGDVYDFSEELKVVLQSPHTRVSSVTMKSFSSIEGSATDNLNSARARYNSVYNYLRSKNVFGRRTVTSKIIGEDWDGLYEWMRGTYWVNDRDILEIVLSEDMPKDVKERRLKDNKAFWGYLEEYVLPEMDRFECVVEYSLQPYSDDAERWQAYNEDHRLLSEYDYSCLMRSLNLWTASWYDVVFDFAEQYPLCRESQINAFAATLSLGHINEASKYLRSSPSNEDMKYYKAVWLMYMGDVEGAYEAVNNIWSKDIKYENTRNQIRSIYDWEHSRTPWKETVISQ